MSHALDNYLQECRKSNITVRKFAYDYEKYKSDLQQKTILETSYETKRVSLFTFSSFIESLGWKMLLRFQ
jgi:hypothetical protein